MESMREALAAKGYDIVDPSAAGADSDSDDCGIPGRIQSLEPDVAREKGKKAFQEGKYDKAIKCWQGGLKSILSSLCSGPQAMSDNNLSELDLTLNLNIAMAHMKKGDFESADRSVDKALARREALPPHQITKALYRKASAQRSMHKLEECIATLKDLLEVEPGNAAAGQMLQEVEREWARQCRAQKKSFKKLFSKMGDEDREMQEQQRAARNAARRRCGIEWAVEDVNSEAYELGEAPACDGKDWGLALSRCVLWSIEQFALEGNCFLNPETRHLSIWFLGVSSTCELRWLQARTIMNRLPGIESLELVLIGFLGELTPDNKREPDPKGENVPQGCTMSRLDGGRSISLRVVKGTLQEALDKELAPVPAASSSSSSAAADAPAVVDGEKEALVADEVPGEGSDAVASEAKGPEDPAPPPQVPPSLCFICHPQLHRYFSDFHPAISWLVSNSVPTAIIGASDPDPSWNQDETLLKSLGANVVVGKRLCPYPMSLPDNPAIRKCNHLIGFLGGKALERDRLTKVKLELLAQDYTVR